jgi:hypothetical protein
MEHRPKNISNKRYKRRTKSTLKFMFQEDPQFDLAGDAVKVKDDISQIESGVKMEPLDGAKFIYLLNYSIVEINNPTYSGVEMGMSKEEIVAMLVSKVSKRRCAIKSKKCGKRQRKHSTWHNRLLTTMSEAKKM